MVSLHPHCWLHHVFILNAVFPLMTRTVYNQNPLLFQAFGFINLVLWVGNLWFVFKETGIIAPFMRAPPPPQGKPAPDTYDQQGAYEQDPYASNQGGYQPNYSQQGYNQVMFSVLEPALDQKDKDPLL